MLISVVFSNHGSKSIYKCIKNLTLRLFSNEIIVEFNGLLFNMIQVELQENHG